MAVFRKRLFSLFSMIGLVAGSGACEHVFAQYPRLGDYPQPQLEITKESEKDSPVLKPPTFAGKGAQRIAACPGNPSVYSFDCVTRANAKPKK